jgi:hypothetical protein
MNIVGSQAWRRDSGLPFQRLEEDTIVVDPKRREVHLLNETAARVWELLESPLTLDELVAALTEEYDASEDEVRASTSELVAELGEKGVFVRA